MWIKVINYDICSKHMLVLLNFQYVGQYYYFLIAAMWNWLIPVLLFDCCLKGKVWYYRYTHDKAYVNKLSFLTHTFTNTNVCNICSFLALCSFFPKKKFETFYFLIQSYLFQNVTEPSSNPCRLCNGEYTPTVDS